MQRLQGQRVGAYVRISDDTDGDAEGVGRQERDVRESVEREGGTVVKVYAENDTSAYRKRRVRQTDAQGRSFYVYRVIRPVYQELLSDLRSGLIDAAMVYDIDRLARDPRDLEDAIEVVEHYRRPILGVGGDIDLTTQSGRSMARVRVVMANQASADTARRVKDKHRDNAERGIPVGGVRPFGWQDDKRTLYEEEAALVREAAQRVLAGAPLSAIVTDWTERGIRTPRKRRGEDGYNLWTPKALGGVLTNPRVCGLSARRVDGPNGRPVVIHVDGEPVQGVWEPILDVPTWEALCAALEPKTRRPGGNAHRYLLSGLVACGKCDERMRGLPRRGGETFAYQCHSKALGGCGGVSILGPDVDRLVTEALFRRYERDRPQVAPVAVWDGEDRLEQVARQLDELKQAWRSGDLDGADYFSLRREVEEERKALERERGQVLAERSAAIAAPEDLRSVWDAYSLTEKRAALSALLEAVVIAPLPALVDGEDGRRVRPRDKDGRVIGTSLAERVRPIWRKAGR
jgi:site-specific DNA recombinase